MSNEVFLSIKKYFNENELFSLEDLSSKKISEGALKEAICRLIKDRKIKRLASGIYYLPGKGEPRISEAIKFRYLEHDGRVFGFYTGEGFLSHLNGKDPSLEDSIELMTNKATSGKKKVYSFSKRFVVRKPYYKVDNNNVALNSFLTYIAMTPLKTIKENYSILSNYIKTKHLSAPDVMDIIYYFPAKTSSKLLSSDLYRSLWKH